jgi:hypothetical protein
MISSGSPCSAISRRRTLWVKPSAVIVSSIGVSLVPLVSLSTITMVMSHTLLVPSSMDFSSLVMKLIVTVPQGLEGGSISYNNL